MGDPNLRKSVTQKKSWRVEICTQVNVIPLNANLSCYNVTDKDISIMSKNIEAGRINMSLCMKFNLNLLSCYKALERKF